MDDEDKKTTEIVEAELVEETSTTGSPTDILLNMEGLIKNHITSIDNLQTEVRKLKEMLDDIFNNDPTYLDHTEKAKEAAKVKQGTKAQILKRPQAADLDKKIKELKASLKENQESLSDYLQEYARMSGTNEIEGDDGEVREIIYVARLVRKSLKF